MAEIHYKKVPDYLRSVAAGAPAPVFLLYGEEYLCRNTFETLLNALVAEPAKAINYEPVDGLDDGIAEALAKVNTYSLIPGKKVVAVLDSQIFHSRRDKEKMLAAAKKAHDDGKMDKAAKQIMGLLTLLDLSLEDLEKEGGLGMPAESGTSKSDDAWLAHVVRHCRTVKTPSAQAGDSAQMLQAAIEKGFPSNNHLVITTDVVDKRKRLYKSIADKGVVIDCSVPAGSRKADKEAQSAVIMEEMDATLDGAGKSIEPGARQAVLEMTGFDLRTLEHNMNKLIAFTGERRTIALADVEMVLRRTKRDPFYEFTNAVTDRDLGGALFYMQSLLADPEVGHPLPLLAAVINQVRKLLVVKSFVQSDGKNVWHSACTYPEFQKRVMPAVQKHDAALTAEAEQWENLPDPDEPQPSGDSKKKRKSASAVRDLLIAREPKNAYPVYQMFRKAERFSFAELISIVHELHETDRRLKTAGQRPAAVLEKALIAICRPG